MQKLIQFLKVILLLVAIAIGLIIIIGAIFVFKGIKSGNLGGYIAQTAVETIAPNTNLTPTQKEMLESGDYNALINDIGENVTPEQVDCATQAVGAERAQELLQTQDPTPQELLKLSKCL